MVTITRQPIEDHQVHSQRLIRHAEEQLAAGDRLQASEKAWGAVAHGLKVIAARRGWRYRTHADVFRMAERLAAEMDEPEVETLVLVANQMHQNFYDDAMSEDLIRRNIDKVKALLDLLRRAASPA